MRQDITDFIRTQSGEMLQYFHEGEHEFLQTTNGVKFLIDENLRSEITEFLR